MEECHNNVIWSYLTTVQIILSIALSMMSFHIEIIDFSSEPYSYYSGKTLAAWHATGIYLSTISIL
jgi:hypothetical protein